METLVQNGFETDYDWQLFWKEQFYVQFFKNSIFSWQQYARSIILYINKLVMFFLVNHVILESEDKYDK